MQQSVWQTVSIGLLSILATGATSWMVFGQDKVSRAEMTEYVQNQGPWLRERGEIVSGIKATQASAQKLDRTVEALVSEQRELLIEQRILVTQVKELISKQ